MAATPNDPQRISPDDVLPPVEPPSAGFIVQLFVIPAVIVAVIIVVWALFNWLAHMGQDPRTYVEALKRNTENRWQEAHNLATELNRTGNEKLRQDPVLAKDLTDLLNSEIDSAQYDDKSVKLRFYLCRVLGEFQLPDVLPVLVKAATTNRDEREQSVQLAAVQGLARLIPNLNDPKLAKNEALVAALIAASQDKNNVVRYHAAYTLGVLGGDEGLKRLEVLVDDADVDVRMNAAVGLARHGDVEAIETLEWMLDPTNEEPAATELIPENKPKKLLDVRLTALSAAAELAKANPQADVSRLATAVDRYIASSPPAGLRAKAEEVKRALAK